MLQSNPQESLEAWEALLDGLAELCTGSALAGTKGSSEGPHPFEGLFPQEALVQLLDLCQTAPARGSVLRITAALSGSQCAVQVQKRFGAAQLMHAMLV